MEGFWGCRGGCPPNISLISLYVPLFSAVGHWRNANFVCPIERKRLGLFRMDCCQGHRQRRPRHSAPIHMTIKSNRITSETQGKKQGQVQVHRPGARRRLGMCVCVCVCVGRAVYPRRCLVRNNESIREVPAGRLLQRAVVVSEAAFKP